MNVKELTHSQQQPQGPKTHKKKPTIRQAIRTVFCAPKGPFLTDSWSWMKSSARHTLSNQQAQEKPENYQSNRKCTKDTFKGSLFGCKQNVSSTTLTIV